MWVVLYPECRILKTPAQLTLRATDFAICISRVAYDVVSRCFPHQTVFISGSLTNSAGVFQCLLQYTWWNLCRTFLCTIPLVWMCPFTKVSQRVTPILVFIPPSQFPFLSPSQIPTHPLNTGGSPQCSPRQLRGVGTARKGPGGGTAGPLLKRHHSG